MELYVKYARTIDNRMTVYKITFNESDEGLGFVCSYKSHDSKFFSNSYIIVNGDLAGLYRYSETETLQECLQHLVNIINCFDVYDCTELHFEGKETKPTSQETYGIDEIKSLFEYGCLSDEE